MTAPTGPGGLGWTTPQPQPPQPQPSAEDLQLAKEIAEKFPDELRVEMERRGLNPSNLTAQGIADAAQSVGRKHLGPELHAFDVKRGIAVDTSQMDPKFVALLESKGVDHATIIETARRLRPDLDPAAAVRWYVQKANRMRGNDVSYGEGFDSRTGKYTTEESPD